MFASVGPIIDIKLVTDIKWSVTGHSRDASPVALGHRGKRSGDDNRSHSHSNPEARWHHRLEHFAATKALGSLDQKALSMCFLDWLYTPDSGKLVAFNDDCVGLL